MASSVGCVAGNLDVGTRIMLCSSRNNPIVNSAMVNPIVSVLSITDDL
jgi:hypothetical protein